MDQGALKYTYQPHRSVCSFVQRHLHAWCVAVKAERHYSGILKRSVFGHWCELVEEVSRGKGSCFRRRVCYPYPVDLRRSFASVVSKIGFSTCVSHQPMRASRVRGDVHTVTATRSCLSLYNRSVTRGLLESDRSRPRS